MSSSADTLSICRVSSGELDLMRSLLAMFGTVFDEIEMYTSATPGDSYLADLLECDDFIAIAATKGNQVIGGLVAYEFRKFEQERSEIYIYDLAVEEAHRREGVATALIEECRVVAETLGAYVMFIQADEGNDPAIALYDKLGTRENVFHFDIEVK